MFSKIWLLFIKSFGIKQDLVAHDEDEYILKARDLALNIDKRRFLRCHLRPKMEEKICNASIFVKELVS